MKRKSLFLGVLAAGLIDPHLVTEAVAQGVPCFPRDEFVKHLGDRWQEATTDVGIAANGELVEVLTSDGGKTWTIIATSPQGLTCPLAAGSDWQPVTPAPTGPQL